MSNRFIATPDDIVRAILRHRSEDPEDSLNFQLRIEDHVTGPVKPIPIPKHGVFVIERKVTK